MFYGLAYGLLAILWVFSRAADPTGITLISGIPAELMIYGFVVFLCGACVWMLIGQTIEAERAREDVRGLCGRDAKNL